MNLSSRITSAKLKDADRKYQKVFGIILAISILLRFYQIDSQLWIDEISAFTSSIQRPLNEIVSQWPGVSSHVFYELLAHLSYMLIGERSLGIRLPAALFGIATVGMTYIFLKDILDRRAAIFIAALTSVSYHNIFFSQNARGYTTLIFFFLLSSHLLVIQYDRNEISKGLGTAYAAAIGFASYSNPFGIFILPAHGLLIVGLYVKSRIFGSVFSFPIWSFSRYAAISGVITVLLYLPLVSSFVLFAKEVAEAPDSGPRFGLELFFEVLNGLKAGFLGTFGLTIAMIIVGAGIVHFFRLHRFALFVLLAPLVLQVVLLGGMGFGLHPRYFSVALPIVFITGGYGCIVIVKKIVSLLTVRAPWPERISGMMMVLTIIISAYPLLGYYRAPKQDFLGAIKVVESLAAPGDIKVGILFAGNVLKNYYKAGYVEVDRLDDLLIQESLGQSIWIVTTLEGLVRVEDSKLYDHLKQNYQLIKILPGTVGDGAMRIYGSAR